MPFRVRSVLPWLVAALTVPCALPLVAPQPRYAVLRAATPAMLQQSNDDPADDGIIDVIVQEELASLALLEPAEQEAQLPTLLQRVEARASSAADDSGYHFGDITRSAVEATRGEVQRQLDADWSMNDLSLLLKVGIFLGAGAAAPVAGLAALPAAALLATYGTVLKAELGVRAVQEVGTRVAERAAQGIADGVKDYTGKDQYAFGDLTEATARKLGHEDYKFGDLTKGAAEGAVKAVTGKQDYKFGQFTEGVVKAATGKDEYRFGDLTRSLLKKRKPEGETKGGEGEKGGGYKFGDVSRSIFKKLKGGDGESGGQKK